MNAYTGKTVASDRKLSMKQGELGPDLQNLGCWEDGGPFVDISKSEGVGSLPVNVPFGKQIRYDRSDFLEVGGTLSGEDLRPVMRLDTQL